MPIFRAEHRLVTIPDKTAQDARLSLAARGLLCLLLSREFTLGELEARPDAPAVAASLRELITFGYAGIDQNHLLWVAEEPQRCPGEPASGKQRSNCRETLSDEEVQLLEQMSASQPAELQMTLADFVSLSRRCEEYGFGVRIITHLGTAQDRGIDDPVLSLAPHQLGSFFRDPELWFAQATGVSRPVFQAWREFKSSPACIRCGEPIDNGGGGLYSSDPRNFKPGQTDLCDICDGTYAARRREQQELEEEAAKRRAAEIGSIPHLESLISRRDGGLKRLVKATAKEDWVQAEKAWDCAMRAEQELVSLEPELGLESFPPRPSERASSRAPDERSAPSNVH